jgi:phosphopantetheine adenylyltransferase
MAKEIVFAWGRFNPPTIGHGIVMDRVAQEAKTRSADYAIFASKSEDPKKNPLSFSDKIKFLKQSFPKHAKKVNSNSRLKTVLDVVNQLNKKYHSITMIVGSDRVVEFEKLLNKYNGKEYDFDNIDVISAGERDPDDPGAAGMSASKMRQAAMDGNFKAFQKGSPLKKAKPLYNAIRKGMHINEYFIDYMQDLHENIVSGRFNRLMRMGLVKDQNIPITQRAFSNFKMYGPQPTMRDIIFNVSQKVIDAVLQDQLLYQRFLQLVVRGDVITEAQRDSLIEKSNKSQIAYEDLLEIYFRGLFTYTCNEDINHQYAFNRVNSFIAGGKSRTEYDKDIWTKYMTEEESDRRDGMKEFKTFLNEKTPPGEWGTKRLSDMYLDDVPGQPNTTNGIKDMAPFTERAPSGKSAESFIKKNKDKFRKQYGENWEKVLYATAWKMFGKKEELELTERPYKYAIEVGDYIIASQDMKEYHVYKGDDYGDRDDFVQSFDNFKSAVKYAYDKMKVPMNAYKHNKIRGYNPK